MRKTSHRDLIILCLLALLLLIPLFLGFTGEGSFREVYGFFSGPTAVEDSARRTILFKALARSSWIGLGATLIALTLGLPAAWALASRNRTPLLLAVCALPLALAPSAAISGWLCWTAPAQVSSAFQTTTPDMPSLGPLFSAYGVAFLLGISLWPIIAFEAWPAFTRARGSAYESALLIGSPLRAFFRIVLPMSSGAVAAGALLVFLLSTSDFTISSLLLVRTLPIEVHDYLSINRSASAAWASMPLVLLCIVAALVMLRIRRHTPIDSRTSITPQSAVRTGKTCDVILVFGLVIGFVIPLAGCGWGAFGSDQPTLQAFQLGLPYLLNSVRLAAVAAIVAIILGAARVAFWPEHRTTPLRIIGLLLLIVPSSFLASGFLSLDIQGKNFLEQWEFWGQGITRIIPPEMTLAFGYAFRFIYLPLRLTEEGLHSLPASLLESAEVAGHGRIQRGLGVALPLVWHYLLGAGALVFILSLGELPLAAKLAPPGAIPASAWLFERQHQGYSEEVFAGSLLLGFVAVAALFIAGGISWWFMSKRKKEIS